MTKLLKIQDICKILSVSKPTLYRMIRDKQIPYIKVRGQLRFDEVGLDNWLHEQQTWGLSERSDEG